MKKVVAIIALLCSSWTASWAGYESMAIKMADGSEMTVTLTDELRARFNEESMLITGGTTDMSVNKADIVSFEFKEASSLGTVDAVSIGMEMGGGTLKFTGLQQDTDITVWSANGTAIMRQTASDDFELPLSQLAPGTYIVTANKMSYKIIVK